MLKSPVSLEDAIREAYRRVLPPGIKPKDYFLIGKEYPLRIAKIVAKEVKHILFVDKHYGYRDNIL